MKDLLYIVGHFVRRDGAFPWYLYRTCVETQQFIPNVTCVKPLSLKARLHQPARPVQTPLWPGQQAFLKPSNSIVFRRSLAWQSVNIVGGEGVVKKN